MILHWQMKKWRGSEFGAQTEKEMAIEGLGLLILDYAYMKVHVKHAGSQFNGLHQTVLSTDDNPKLPSENTNTKDHTDSCRQQQGTYSSMWQLKCCWHN
jgi:hypothetical protein